MLLSHCALSWRHLLLDGRHCFGAPFLSYVCCEGQCHARQVVCAFASSFVFPAQKKWIYFTVSCVCSFHFLLTNGALAAVCCFAFISPPWLILDFISLLDSINSWLKSSGVLTLHLCLLLSIHLLVTMEFRRIVASFSFLVTYAPHFRVKCFSWNAGPPSSI